MAKLKNYKNIIAYEKINELLKIANDEMEILNKEPETINQYKKTYYQKELIKSLEIVKDILSYNL